MGIKMNLICNCFFYNRSYTEMSTLGFWREKSNRLCVLLHHLLPSVPLVNVVYPVGQSVHESALSVSLYVPTGQGKHLLLAESLKNPLMHSELSNVKLNYLSCGIYVNLNIKE